MKPTHAQVTQVSAWRTQDGELFSTAHEANAYAAKLNFVSWYRSGNGLREIHGIVADGHDVADWLIDNRTAILEFLLLTEAQQKEARHAV